MYKLNISPTITLAGRSLANLLVSLCFNALEPQGEQPSRCRNSFFNGFKAKRRYVISPITTRGHIGQMFASWIAHELLFDCSICVSQYNVLACLRHLGKPPGWCFCSSPCSACPHALHIIIPPGPRTIPRNITLLFLLGGRPRE